MNWLGTQMAFVDVAINTIEFALNWLLQSSLLLAVGLTMGKLLRQRGSAVQSVVYRTTMVAVLLCPLATWGLSQAGVTGWSLNLPEDWGRQRLDGGVAEVDQQAPVTAAELADPILTPSIPTTEFAQDSNERFAQTQPSDESSPITLYVEQATELPAAAVSPSAERFVESVPERFSTSLLGYGALGVAGLWLIASLTLFARLATAWRQLAGLRKRAEQADGDTFLACHELASTLSISTPEVLRSPCLPSPCLAGLRRPAVLLPEDYHSLSIREVLIHELAHLRRLDCHWNLLRQIATSLFFFQPLLWKLSRRIETTAEEVCDDFVVQLGGDRHQYAHRLVDIAELSSVPVAAAGVGIVSFRSMLAKRVSRIMDTSRSLSTRVGSFFLALVVIAGLIGTSITGLVGLAPRSTQAEAESIAAETDSTSDTFGDREANVDIMEDDGVITVRGTVVDPKVEPIAGAKIWLAVASQRYHKLANREGLLRELGTTDEQGRFEIVLDAVTTQEIRQRQEIHKRFNYYQTQLVATAQGHGPDWMPLDVFVDNPAPSAERDTLQARLDQSLGDGRFASRTLKLRPESRSVRGRLVDLEGNRLPNVSVLVESLRQPDIPRLLKAFEMSWKREVNEAFSATSFGVGGLARSELQELIPPVTTDENGEFELRGIGDDQLVRLVFDADRVEARPLYVLGREMETVSLPHISSYPAGTKDVFVGRDFTYAVGPSVPVEGVVTDYDMGQPVAGVLVYVERLFKQEDGQLRLRTSHMRSVTDGQGRFRITGMPPGEGHVLEVVPRKSEPYLETSQDVSLSLEDGEAKRIEIQVKRGIWIEGRVTDKQSGEPLSATVGYLALKKNPHALEKSGLDWRWLTERYWTDSDGHYRVLGLPGPGVLLVTMQVPGYPKAAGAETIDGYDASSGIIPTIWPQQVSNWHLLKQIDPAADAISSTCDLVLDADVSIPGRVVGPRGKPISDFYVLGQTEGDQWWRPRHTDYVRTTDRFAVYGYDGKGPRQLFFKNQDETLVGQYRLEGEAPDEIVVTLQPSVRVTGRLIDNEIGLPATRYFLSCEKCFLFNKKYPPVDFMTPWCFTDDKGHFEIKGLMAGHSYTMDARSDTPNLNRNRFKIDLTAAKPGDVIDLGTIDDTSDDLPEPVRMKSTSAVDTNNSNSSSTEDKSTTAVAGRDEDVITVRGTVVDPDGEPAAGATVEVQRWIHDPDEPKVPLASTKSNKKGRFELAYPTWEHVTIVASAEGFGVGFIRQDTLKQGEEPTLKLVRDDVPVHGRVVDLEGKPLAGLTVKAGGVAATADENLDEWLKAIQRGEILWEATNRLFVGRTPQNPSNVADIVTTGADGSFSISGIGREGEFHVTIEGPTIAYTRATIVTRDMDPVVANDGMPHPEWSRKHTIYGANFQIVAAPTQPIQGVVRDSETGEPLPGVTVESYRMTERGTSGQRLIRTKSDDLGRYQLVGMPKGSGKRVIAVPTDDQPYLMREFDVPDQPEIKPIELNLDLHRGVWITGRVTDKKTGDPVGGRLANAQYYPYLSNPYAQDLPEYDDDGNTDGYQQRYKIDENGRFRLVGLPGKAIVGAIFWNRSYPQGQGSELIDGADKHGHFPTFRLGVGASTLNPTVMREVDIPEGTEEFTVDFRIDRGHTIHVTTTNSTNETVGRLWTVGAEGRARWKNIDGPRFDVVGLMNRRERTLLIHDQGNRLGKALQISPGESSDQLTIELLPCITVRGRVVDDNDQPISGARIRFSPRPGGDYSPELKNASTNDEGLFVHDGVLPGTSYNVMVESVQQGFSTLAKELEVRPGETINLGTIDVTSEERPEPVRMESSGATARPSIQVDEPQQISVILGRILDADANPAAGAHVAVIARRNQLRQGGDYTPNGEVLAEGTTDDKGHYNLRWKGANSKTHNYASLIARKDGAGIAWQRFNLDEQNAEVSLELPEEEPIRGKLVDIEGQPAVGVQLEVQSVMKRSNNGMSNINGVRYRAEQAPAAWLPTVTSDEQGQFILSGVPANHGVYLNVIGNDRFAPQGILLNSGKPEQRGERDGTYRSLIKNVEPGEKVVLPLAPAQVFEGVVTYEDTGEPAPHARLTIWASDQEPHGSMVSVDGKADSEGRYRISPKPGIRFGVTAYPPEDKPYLARKTPLDDAIRWEVGDTSRRVDIALPRGVLVRGKIVEEGSDTPVSNATIQYIPEEANNPNDRDDVLTGWQGIQLSDDQGEFAIAVLPGPGRLLGHGPQGKYVLQEIAGRQLARGEPGGHRNYAHAILRINPKDISEPLDLTVSLKPGETVEGRIVDENGVSADEVMIVTRLLIHPTSLTWEGQSLPILGGKFELSGLEPNKEYPVHFLDTKRRLGATVNLRASLGTTTIELKPCGEAKMRFVDPEGDPLVDYRPDLHMVVTPGVSWFDYEARKRGELTADEDYVANINRSDFHWNGPRTDRDGRVTLLELIPGATYRMYVYENGENKILEQFTVESGETLDLDEFVVDRND